MVDDLKKMMNFNKGQRRAIVILSLVILSLVIYRYWQSSSPKDIVDNSRAINEVNIFINSLDSVKQDIKTSHKPNNIFEENIVINLQPFNPNMMTKKSWMGLGLSEYQANLIQKYVSAGGHFYKKEDLKKMYCLTLKDYFKLEPYIILDENKISKNNFNKKNAHEYLNIELNSATASELLDVDGIGARFSESIIKYRDLLGGFYSLAQLREVYGIDSIKYEKIYRNFNVDKSKIIQIDLNKADFYSLKKHPYISKRLAFEISNYLKFKGKFKSIEDLKNINYINEAIYQKIYHYFVIH